MSRIYDMLQLAERNRGLREPETRSPSARVVSVVNNKGGIGKSTLTRNLAVYLRALHEELPILVLSLDDQSPVDRMFGLGGPPAPQTLTAAPRRASPARAN